MSNSKLLFVLLKIAFKIVSNRTSEKNKTLLHTLDTPVRNTIPPPVVLIIPFNDIQKNREEEKSKNGRKS